MRYTCIALIVFAALIVPRASRADAPATEFFVIETSKLAKLAQTDAALDSLSGTQLSVVSIAHGWYGGGLSMRFDTATFRIDARFGGSVNHRGVRSGSIDYRIDASNDRTSWSLVSTGGTATKQGNQFITENWRKQSVTVVLRLLDLKK